MAPASEGVVDVGEAVDAGAEGAEAVGVAVEELAPGAEEAGGGREVISMPGTPRTEGR